MIILLFFFLPPLPDKEPAFLDKPSLLLRLLLSPTHFPKKAHILSLAQRDGGSYLHNMMALVRYVTTYNNYVCVLDCHLLTRQVITHKIAYRAMLLPIILQANAFTPDTCCSCKNLGQRRQPLSVSTQPIFGITKATPTATPLVAISGRGRNLVPLGWTKRSLFFSLF